MSKSHQRHAHAFQLFHGCHKISYKKYVKKNTTHNIPGSDVVGVFWEGEVVGSGVSGETENKCLTFVWQC